MRSKIIGSILCFVSLILTGAIAVQVNTYQDGNVLTAAQLNSEFGNIYSTLNSIDQTNFSPSIIIPPQYIDASIAGPGLGVNLTTGELNVNVDGNSIEIAADITQVKDAGITTAKIADLNVTTDKINTNAVTTVKILDSNVTTSKIADRNVTIDKVLGATASSTSGSIDTAIRFGSFETVNSVVTSGNTETVSSVTVSSAVSQGVVIEVIPRPGDHDTRWDAAGGLAGNGTCTITIAKGATVVSKHTVTIYDSTGTLITTALPFQHTYDTIDAGSTTYVLTLSNTNLTACGYQNIRLVARKSGT